MENKYYTPGLKEFHVGFEYEAKFFTEKQKPNEKLSDYLKNHPENKIEWRKMVWTDTSSFLYEMNVENDGFDGIKSITVPDSIRVKHLDREDIEECGWECIMFNKEYNSGEFKISPNKILSFNLVDYFCIIKHINFPEAVEPNIISIFQGVIKNKSELIKLMEMLNIEAPCQK